MNDEVKDKLRWLEALEAAGVDNWDGYDYALEIFNASDSDGDE